MERLWRWLENEACGFKIIKVILSALVISLLNSYFWAFALIKIMGYPEPNSPLSGMSTAELFVTGVILAPLIEEMLYRFFPLAIAVNLSGGRRWLIISTAIVSSMIFGYHHFGWLSLPIQGVAGLILSGVFLKCGGLSGNFTKAVACSITLHALFNFLAIFVLS